MKTRILLLLMAFSLAIVSCNDKPTKVYEEAACPYPLEIEDFKYADSSKYCLIKIEGILPIAKDSVSQAIRDTMIAILGDYARHCTLTEGDEPVVAEYKGSTENANEVFSFYGRGATKVMAKDAKDDYDSRAQSIEEDSTLTNDEREKRIEDFMPYTYTMEVSKLKEDSDYVVFYDQEYFFYGGVHGGIGGAGAMTFSMKDGKRITDFFKPNVLKDMQPLLKKGLKEYFSEYNDETIKTDQQLMEQLMLADENGLIPLPSWTPYPNENGKGLTFVYKQYEIACYAAGMPDFDLTWEELEPFLKDEYKQKKSSRRKTM